MVCFSFLLWYYVIAYFTCFYCSNWKFLIPLFLRWRKFVSSSLTDYLRENPLVQISENMECSWAFFCVTCCCCQRAWNFPCFERPKFNSSWHQVSQDLVSLIVVVYGVIHFSLLMTLIFQLCRIHCTYMGVYTSTEVLGSVYPGTIYNDFSLESFSFSRGTPHAFGRCFIEVAS